MHKRGLSAGMNLYSKIVFLLEVLFFWVLGFLVLYDQYQNLGIWFQFTDLHHETFAIATFALAAGIIIGSSNKK